jgi:hypothetical protein
VARPRPTKACESHSEGIAGNAVAGPVVHIDPRLFEPPTRSIIGSEVRPGRANDRIARFMRLRAG